MVTLENIIIKYNSNRINLSITFSYRLAKDGRLIIILGLQPYPHRRQIFAKFRRRYLSFRQKRSTEHWRIFFSGRQGLAE